MIAPGLFRVSRDVAEKLATDATSSGNRIFVLPTGVHDEASLVDAIREALPLAPPLGTRNKWDALEDSLWSGLHALPETNILVVWPDASEMFRRATSDFETAAAVFEGITRTIDDPRYTNGVHKKVAFVLGGAWPD
jgi:hypothetical protein